MPRFQHLVSVARPRSFRTEKVSGMFDVPPSATLTKAWDITADFDATDWSIGVIVGPSGSGKSTMAKKMFGDVWSGHTFPESESVLDGFPADMEVNDICRLLTAVGFSSPPSWLLPYRLLSNGQQFRAQLAVAMATSQMLVFDEFTSVVDRTVAKACAACVAKQTRKDRKRFVAVTCHYDVLEWLEPDWVVDMADGSFTRRQLQRPTITIEVVRSSPKVWPVFAPHHYLSADMHKAARVYLAIMDGNMVAMCSDIHFCHPHVNNMRRIHRLVTLPDFQGFGIGPRLLACVAAMNATERKRTSITTSHQGLIRSLDKQPTWKMTRHPSMIRVSCAKGIMHSRGAKDATKSFGRLTASFEWCGGAA